LTRPLTPAADGHGQPRTRPDIDGQGHIPVDAGNLAAAVAQRSQQEGAAVFGLPPNNVMQQERLSQQLRAWSQI